MTPQQIKELLITIAIIGILACFGALSWYGNKVKTERDTALTALGAKQEQLRLAGVANGNLKDQIDQMAQTAKQNYESQMRVQGQLNDLTKLFQHQSTQLDQIEKNNATVRDYLAIPVPDDLRRLYNAAPASSAVADPKGRGTAAPASGGATR